MPSWLIQTAYLGGAAKTPNLTHYFTPAGAFLSSGVEARHQLVARDAYTWGGGYFRTFFNTLDVDATVRSRKNGANGNQLITITGGVTGAFEDAVNTDSLVDGDTFDWMLSIPAGTGFLLVNIVSSYLTSSNNSPIIISSNATSTSTPFALIRYSTMGGNPRPFTTEAHAQYRMRTASTLSNFGIFVQQNTFDGATVITVRINGAPGAQSVTFGAGITGFLEDVVNTDAVAVADLVSLQTDATASTVGSMVIYFSEMKSACLARHCLNGNASNTSAQAGGATVYLAVEGDCQVNRAAEADSQSACRVAFTARNAYCYIGNNSSAASTLTLRQNGAGSGVVLNIPASTSGVFEDTVNTADFVAADLINWELITGAAGSLYVKSVGFEQHQPAAAAPAGSVVPLVMGSGMV